MGIRFSNPIGFTPIPVTIISSFVYVALFVALLTTHLIVPSAPSNNSPIAGINLTEAWQDLQHISGVFHPYNSRRNDETRDWLLRRIERILASNTRGLMFDRSKYLHNTQFRAAISRQSPAVVFSDVTSNVTFSSEGKKNDSTSDREPGVSVYFEGTNIFVYIRGSEDGDQDWWSTGQQPPEKGGVLVNAHYDSVSTGYGATDDGVGLVTILQIIKHFTTEGKKPKKGIVALFNNGEEDYLNGARAFSQHPMSKFPRTFLNLEGAGAGGKAVMFRSTDTQVTKAYQKAMYPFASVLSGDAFKRGLIRSETDYRVFTETLGFRGLDVAFYEPRARYHTDQDDVRHTDVNSLWHMLSASIPTLEALSSDMSGSDSDRQGSDAVWFDLFGRILAVFELHTLFALSVALLVVAPLILTAVGIALYRVDKLYIFSRKKQAPNGDDVDSVPLHGWKGFFQYLVLLVPASAAVIGLAFLMNKLFGLPRKSQYAEEVNSPTIVATPRHRSQSISSGQPLAQASEEQQRPGSSERQHVEADEEATERTSLLRSDRHTTFAHYPHRNENPTEEHALDETKERKVYLGEQAWSWSLPGWLWILQFLLLSVIPIILTGEVALFFTSATSQTLADGSSILLPYIAIAFFTILLLIPVSPFIHRYTYHVPTFLFIAFVGTLIYNLLAFPFSPNNRLKVYFDQRVDLDTGINTVSLTGIKDGPYLRQIATSLPSAAGQEITCVDSKGRLGLQECSWHGLPPEVVPSISPLRSEIPPEFRYAGWLSYDITHGNMTRNEAHITVSGKNTRACKLMFDTPISDFSVSGAAAEDERFPKVPTEGSKELRLWSRTWEKPWHVKVRWNGGKDNDRSFQSVGLRKQQGSGHGLNGRVVCLWSDANESGVIPALDEVWKYAPTWVAVSKNSDGLVEGSKRFLV
ncbi:MAG: hypothetical protein Q9196_002800 [Gyalolechia fulgens]